MGRGFLTDIERLLRSRRGHSLIRSPLIEVESFEPVAVQLWGIHLAWFAARAAFPSVPLMPIIRRSPSVPALLLFVWRRLDACQAG
jgi:hypothetical protein